MVRGKAPVQQAASVHMSQGLQDGLCMCDQTIQAGPLVGGGQAAALPPCLLPVTNVNTHGWVSTVHVALSANQSATNAGGGHC